MFGEYAKNFIYGYKMGKDDKAIYAPGELARVRNKLGDLDLNEAQQIAKKLGGEVGVERSLEDEKARLNPNRGKTEYPLRSRPRRALEPPPTDDDDTDSETKSSQKKKFNPGDDPSIPIKLRYWERVKMDRLAGQSEFEIKSHGQVFMSIFSPFSTIPDYVNPYFVTKRLKEYYKKIEVLVTSTRTMLPRNNTRRTEKFKRSAPLAFSIIDVIRYWDIEKISGNLGKIQTNPKNVRVGDLADILKAIYKPIFVLEKLDLEAHIRTSYKILIKLLATDAPDEVQANQELAKAALTAYTGVRREIHYLLYPLLMKSVSGKYMSYHEFFAERKRRIMAFLNVNETDQMNPAAFAVQDNTEESKKEGEESKEGGKDQQAEGEKEKEEEISEEEMERRNAREAEKKALERGLHILETLFPQAGWDKLPEFPDLFPYFADILDLRRGIVYIAPTDPMLQVIILMRILEELFFGIRQATFGSIHSLDGNVERVDTILGEVINDWRYYREVSFEKEYLPRMAEYIRILEGPPGERNSAYTKKLVSEMHWIKRLFLLPYYKFDSFVPSPFQKGNTTQIYTHIKALRKYLAAVAVGIERGIKAGGADAQAPCDGIENPWAPYAFQVPNHLSVRLDVLLPPRQKNNASLIFFCLAVTSVLDYLVNNENSWAYGGSRSSPLFRSVDGEGNTPLTGVDKRVDANAIFKQVQRNKAGAKKD